nr:MAG TPA: hypothetical protein [Caudoviricetes sp.]
MDAAAGRVGLRWRTPPTPGTPLRGPESPSDGLCPPGWCPGRGGVSIGPQIGSCAI